MASLLHELLTELARLLETTPTDPGVSFGPPSRQWVPHMTQTMKGPHGTLYRYQIIYTDLDPACPRFKWRCWAYDQEHARALFDETGADPDDWRIISIKRI